MSVILIAFLLLTLLVLVGISYVNNRSRSLYNGGFVFSPIPFILLNYALIFAYRPLVILYYDALTLNFAVIDNEKAIKAIQLGLFSLCVILLPYFFDFYRRSLKRVQQHLCMNKIYINRLVWLNIFFSVLIVIGLSIYGSALNNTGDRLENSSEYKAFFLFIITQRFHFVLSVLTFYIYLSFNLGRSFQLIFLVCLLSAPVLSLFAAGRGAAFYILIAYGVIYVFARSVRLSWWYVVYIGAAGIFFSFLNFLLSIVRVVINSTGWEWIDLVDALNFSLSNGGFENSFILASWDYSVFDVLVTIIDELNDFTFGATNFHYFLSYIPRVVWPDKPFDQGFMLYVTNQFYGDVFSTNGSTFAGTLVGEGYLNFGIIGVFVYSFVFSVLLYRIYKNACQSADSNAIIIYALAFPFSQQVIRGGLDVIVNFGILILIPLWIFNKLLWKSSRRAHY
jgi:oligosaccharide repeat unit polymerase